MHADLLDEFRRCRACHEARALERDAELSRHVPSNPGQTKKTPALSMYLSLSTGVASRTLSVRLPSVSALRPDASGLEGRMSYARRYYKTRVAKGERVVQSCAQPCV